MTKKKETKQVVINSCFGGFGLSPEATLWLYEKGAKIDVTPVKKYFNDESYKDRGFKELNKWRDYLKDPKSFKGLLLYVFSPDEQFVLNANHIDRSDPLLVECVKTLGEKANGAYAKLKIVDIPADVEYEIDEYDGMESIEEVHKSWY